MEGVGQEGGGGGSKWYGAGEGNFRREGVSGRYGAVAPNRRR